MWELLLFSGVGWVIGVIGISLAFKTKKDYAEQKKMLKQSLEIIGNLEKKLDALPESQTIPTQPSHLSASKRDISNVGFGYRAGTDWDKKKWIKTDPVQEVINYGIEQFGKKVVNDLLGIDEDDFEFECPKCGAPLYEDEVKCPECGEEFDE